MIYKYEGPIYQFNEIVIPKFVAYTTAISIPKAKNNFLFKAKRKLKLSQSAKLSLKENCIKSGKTFSNI